MNDKFDELAKGLAQSVTRRGALKKFGLGLAGVVLASLGLVNTAQAGPRCVTSADCGGKQFCFSEVCAPANQKHCNYCIPNYGCPGFDPEFAACYEACLTVCAVPGGG